MALQVIMLSKLEFELLAPTAGFLLFHLVEVEEEKDWPAHLSRYHPMSCQPRKEGGGGLYLVWQFFLSL
jgi:hypothetical protein